MAKKQPHTELENVMESLQEGRSKYLMINLISQRVRQFHEGDRPLVEHESGADPIEIALDEMRQGKWKVAHGRKEREEVDSEFAAALEEEE